LRKADFSKYKWTEYDFDSQRMKSHEVKNQSLILLREKISELLNIRPEAPFRVCQIGTKSLDFLSWFDRDKFKFAKIRYGFDSSFSLMTPRGHRT
jgi:hypothetical protein